MTKDEIHQRFVDQLALELETITTAAQASFDTATDEEHHAEGKYDTFSLEASYLARGQAKRVEELRTAVERMQQLPLRAFTDGDPIVLGALVRMRAENGETRTVFLGPSAGGEELEIEGESIVIVTSRSPLGSSILGKTLGESFGIKLGPIAQTFTITSVE
ncbi:MAG: transcription elongation factor GreAB [Verrucomicrobia bacterium]|jgi:transcription elongation GreA/GreB family factor|nr:transcription elongation factor GreAB [Verrucomicrobiota bacterium]